MCCRGAAKRGKGMGLRTVNGIPSTATAAKKSKSKASGH